MAGPWTATWDLSGASRKPICRSSPWPTQTPVASQHSAAGYAASSMSPWPGGWALTSLRGPRPTAYLSGERSKKVPAGLGAADSKRCQGAQTAKPRPLPAADGRISTLSSGRPYGVGKADNAALGRAKKTFPCLDVLRARSVLSYLEGSLGSVNK